MFGRKQKRSLITGIDVGSSAIRIAVGQYTVDHRGGAIQIIGAAEAPSAGVHKGVVNSIEEVISSISHALEQVEHTTGMPVESSWLGITGTDVIIEQSRGVVSVAKPDGEISPDDIERSVQAARMVAVPLNYDILHVMPVRFTVDGQAGVRDPAGMTGLRLEVDTQIVYGVSSHLKNVSKAVYRTGIDIDDIVLSVLATGDAVVTERQKALGVAVVSIGGSTTSVAVYEGGDVLHAAVLPIGSEHITNDLAIGLRTAIDVAERVKLNYGYCVAHEIPKKEKIDLSALGGDGVAAHQFIAQIVEARVTEILEKVDAELARVGRSGLLPAGVVFTGGGAKISGLIELAKSVLRLPATLGYPIDIPSVTHHTNDLSFSGAIGLVKWGSRVHHSPNARWQVPGNTETVKKLWKNVQRVGKWLMP